MPIVSSILLGIFLVILLIAVVVAGYRFHKGHGPMGALLGFFLTVGLGVAGMFLLFLLYAGAYYAGGGH